MSQFPEPIILADSIPMQRALRKKEIFTSSVWGIVLRLCIIVVEFLGVAFFNSSALLLDAIASVMDVASSIVLLIFIRVASRPPDSDHPFGHGRFEPLAGLQLSLLMMLVGGGMAIQQGLQMFTSSSEHVMDPRTWLIPFFAVILLEISYRVVMNTAKRNHSPALAAEAVHYRIDALNSVFACIALLAAAFIPSWSVIFDHAGALTIAILMVGIGVSAAKNNLNQLMDRIPDSTFFDKVRNAAQRVSGVFGTEKLRIQVYGPDAHVDIDIEVDPQLSVENAHVISQKVRAEIKKDWPAVQDVIVHIEPFYENDH